MAIEIYKGSWRVPEIFRIIQKRGNVDTKEMYRTLNMGIGMVLVVDRKNVERTKDILLKNGVRSYVIGKVIEGNKEVIIR